MNDSNKPDDETKPGVIRHSILGVIALAVAALDFTFGTRSMIGAGILALAASVYSFTRAYKLRRSQPRTRN
ncbi:hypothetical protein ABIE52_006809 [Rhodococcus sp. OAS809]|uniref:hypothetical protein n=1 Tax=Rhodococcus sp. OAS809 TaxID=2663874 RepID=UPI0017890521